MTEVKDRYGCRAAATAVSRARDTAPSHYLSYLLVRPPEVEVGAFSRRRVRGRFLKGPVMMRDIAAAARLPGQALAVLLAAHHRRDLTRQEEVTIPKALLDEMGVSRDSKARALAQLEQAGLVYVSRQKGRGARIRLVENGDNDDRKIPKKAPSPIDRTSQEGTDTA